MKSIKNILLTTAVLGLAVTSCADLDRYPLDAGSSETWFTTPTEYEMAAADMYRGVWWDLAKEAWSDDYTYRKIAGPDIIDGTLNSETNTAGSVELETVWINLYKAVVRANTIINNIPRGENAGVNQQMLDSYEGQARFARACHYGHLVFYWGDVVYVDKETTIEEAYKMGRTPKAEIIKHIYEDFDRAAELLNVSNGGKQIFTKGAAYAMKARYALYFGDFDVAAEAAKKCIDLKYYRLHPDYLAYFQAKNDLETVFGIPSSSELEVNTIGDSRSYVPRLVGGTAAKCPSWAIFASYECTDGKTIDKSPLFDSHNPFKNRDPRCTMSLVEFGTEHLGFEIDPRPSKTKVMDYSTGKLVKNKDSYPCTDKNASFTGLYWKKRVAASWGKAGMTDIDKVIIRYADVLLIYAEAMIEQNKIDDTVLNAINQVRARAYKCGVDETSSYPAITTTNQTELRKIVRRERRVELAFEGLRYYDLIRWGIAEKALNVNNCGLRTDANEAKKIESKGYWFWHITPTIDEDGIPNFDALVAGGYCDVHSKGNFQPRQYLWPIPAGEIIINENMTQNPGY